jgi:putative (di)nucleoside polyphosphate hydrolase
MNSFRPNVGIIVFNKDKKLLLTKRIKTNIWQFPQGGINKNEKPEEAMYRELYEEIGLSENDVNIISETKDWHKYYLPSYIKNPNKFNKNIIGQRQKYFLLELKSSDEKISFTTSNEQELDEFKWVNYWYPLFKVVAFKQEVYRNVLLEFKGLI